MVELKLIPPSSPEDFLRWLDEYDQPSWINQTEPDAEERRATFHIIREPKEERQCNSGF